MTREELLRSPEYWEAKAQIELHECALRFMEKNGLNRSQLAGRLGVTKGYVTQILNGDFDHRLSKFFELALAFGFVPKIEFKETDAVIEEDERWETKKARFVMEPIRSKAYIVYNNESPKVVA